MPYKSRKQAALFNIRAKTSKKWADLAKHWNDVSRGMKIPAKKGKDK